MSKSTKQTPPQRQSTLRQVRCGPKVQTLFITIAGADTLHPDGWSDGNGDIWLATIKPSSAPDAGIFSFNYKLVADEALFWQQVEDEGANFLSALNSLVQLDELQMCPIVLFSHSVGGIILKRAMCLAHQQTQRFRDLLRNIAGAVFFGTPHSRSDSQDVWQVIPSVLKMSSKRKSKYTITREIARALADDSLYFEKAFEQVPVLSAYETAETRIGGLFGAKILLVEEQLTKINIPFETTLPIRSDHNHICCIEYGSKEFAIITSFIDSTVEEARKVIERVSDEYVRPPALESTVRSRSSVGSLHRLEHSQQIMRDLSPSWVTLSHKFDSKDATTGSTAASFEMIPSLSNFSIDKSEPRLPCYMLPLGRNRGFFGRESILQTIHEALFPPEHPQIAAKSNIDRVKSFSICGPGGMGKTQIVTEFAYRHKTKYDAIFWVHADEPSKIAHDFSSIAVELGLLAKDSMDAKDEVLTRELVLGWLSHPLKSFKQLEKKMSQEASWLLIFDNVDNPDILDDYWPLESSGSVLVTSRDPLVKTFIYSDDSGIFLPPFDLEEATKLLLKLTAREYDTAEWEMSSAVAEVLGCLPLAMTQMARVIARKDLGFREFLDLYEKESARADLFKLQIGPSKTKTGYEHTIASVWALESLKKGAPVLDVLSVLDPDGVPEYILNTNPAVAAWDGYPQTEDSFEDARADLLQSSLITRDRNAKKIVIHRLIQDTTRTKMTDEWFNIVFNHALCMISAVWPYEDFGFGNEQYRWARCDDLYPHVLRLEKLCPRFTPPKQLVASSLESLRLVLDAAWFSIMRSRFNETLLLLNMAQMMCEAIQSQSQSQGLDLELKKKFDFSLRISHHHRGALGLHTNEPKVSLLHLQVFTNMVLEAFRDAPSRTDQDLGVAWNELGNAFGQNEDWSKAEDCFLKSISALEALEGATRISISMPLINLAFAYLFQGRLAEAASTFQDALDDREAEFGLMDKTSFVTGKLLLGFGNVRAAQHRWEESFTLHQRCLLQYKSSIGNNHHRTGDGCVKVFDHYVRIGQYDAALTLIDQASKIYGDREHFVPEKARVLYKRGNLLRLMGKPSLAEKDGSEALVLFQKLRPLDQRPLMQLKDKDFDENIMFWSR